MGGSVEVQFCKQNADKVSLKITGTNTSISEFPNSPYAEAEYVNNILHLKNFYIDDIQGVDLFFTNPNNAFSSGSVVYNIVDITIHAKPKTQSASEAETREDVYTICKKTTSPLQQKIYELLLLAANTHVDYNVNIAQTNNTNVLELFAPLVISGQSITLKDYCQNATSATNPVLPPTSVLKPLSNYYIFIDVSIKHSVMN